MRQMRDGRAILRILIIATLFAVAIVAAFKFHHSLWFRSANWATGADSKKTIAEVERICSVLLDQRSIDAASQRGWDQMREQMRQQKVSAEEINGVMSSAQNFIRALAAEGNPINAVPVYIRKSEIGDERVWVLGLGWGILGPDPEPPNHYRVLLIGAQPPHKVMEEAWCC